MTMTELMLNLIETASVLAATIIALVTVRSWRAEHRYGRRADVAGEALVLAYQSRDAIKAVRNPIGFGGEGSTRPQFKGEKPEQAEQLNNAYAPLERLNQPDELFAKMRAHRYKMMVEFGPEWRNAFDGALDFSSKLFTRCRLAIRNILDDRASRRSPEAIAKFEDEFEALRWESDDNDPVNEQINAMVKRLEDLCASIKR